MVKFNRLLRTMFDRDLANTIWSPELVEAAISGPQVPMAKFQGMDPLVANAFGNVQESLGYELPVTSTLRSEAHNTNVGGADKSRHMSKYGGDAIDVSLAGLPYNERVRVAEEAAKHGFTGLGGYDTSMHMDTRGVPAIWGPTYKKESAPDWLRTGVNMMEERVPASIMEAPPPMASNQPTNSLMEVDPRVDQQWSTEPFNVASELAKLNEEEGSFANQRWAGALMALSKGLGQMAAGQPVDVSQAIRWTANRRAEYDKQLKANREKVILGATLSRMDGGRPYAEALMAGAPLEQVMEMYRVDTQHRNNVSLEELRQDFQSKEAEVRREFEADQAGLDRGFRSEQADLDRELDRSRIDISREELGLKQLEFEYEKAQDEDDAVAASRTGAALRDAALARASQIPGPAGESLVETLQGIDVLDDDAMKNMVNIMDDMQGDSTLVQDYNAYVADEVNSGRSPMSMFDWDIARRRATVQQPQNLVDLERAKSRMTRANTYLDNKMATYDKLRSRKAEYEQMAALIAQGTSTGAIQAAIAPAARIATSLGILPENWAKLTEDQEKFEALQNSLYASYSSDMKGAITDYEGRILASGGPQLGKSEAANLFLINFNNQVIERSGAEAAYLERATIYGDKTPLEAQREWDAKVKRGDPDAYPAFVDADNWTDKNLIDKAQTMQVGDIIYIGGKFKPITAEALEMLRNGDL